MGVSDGEKGTSSSRENDNGHKIRTQSEDGQPRRTFRISSRYKFGQHSYTEGAKKIHDLETEIKGLQHQLISLNDSIATLKTNIEAIRPAYREALSRLSSSPLYSMSSSSTFPPQQIKKNNNNLLFHGIQVDEIEGMMSSEPDFCRDVLETRIKLILKEQMKISRDIAFNDVYRLNPPLTSVQTKDTFGPVVVNFKSPRDKENVLRQSRVLKNANIWVSEYHSDKSSNKPFSTSKYRINNPKPAGRRQDSSSNSEQSHKSEAAYEGSLELSSKS